MRAARALLRWSVEDLAKSANVSVMTIRRAEGNDGPVKMLPNNLGAIRAALEFAGVIFVDENVWGSLGGTMRTISPSRSSYRPSSRNPACPKAWYASRDQITRPVARS